MKNNRYQWAASGDINAFFGLALDNIAGLILFILILKDNFEFPVEFTIRYMVPGTALGVLAGDLMYFVLAFVLARRTGRSDVTAMPLGLDTPSTIGMALFVIGPAYQSALIRLHDQFAAAQEAWHIGIWAIIITGVIKLILSLGSGWVQRFFPRAGLLGSLAAIALGIIAFTQLQKILSNPLPGFASLLIVLVTLIGRNRLPGNLPGAFAAVAVGSLLWHLMNGSDQWLGTSMLQAPPPEFPLMWFPPEWLTVFRWEWVGSWEATVSYLPYIIPFAITTVIGGIDCTESAASAGDRYSTGSIISVEALATILAGICGGVVQTTPYIGHPAYKAMGGRAAYVLATALFVGSAGFLGYFTLLFNWIPEAAVLPILIFVGLEITAQSFHATPRRHYAALALACMPAFAKLVMIFVGQFMGIMNFEAMLPFQSQTLLYLSVLAGGFIITSLLWSSALAEIIDRQFLRAALYLTIAAAFTAVGMIHSPLAGDKMFWPTELLASPGQGTFDASQLRIVWEMIASYLLMAALLVVIWWTTGEVNPPLDSDEEFERLA